ncbi:hypothetical protein, partial [Turicimonas muris]|uniref:hypothetical protein n=1 Tax=Turicimonas muris TaxID=1796652 RepID=UPI0025A5C1B9
KITTSSHGFRLPTNNCKQRANAGKSAALIEPWEPYFDVAFLCYKNSLHLLFLRSVCKDNLGFTY